MYTGRFDETKPDSTRWKEIIDINVMHVGVMTQMFKGRLIERQAKSNGKVRSAIINVSSAMGYL